jgi:hypothetical protein
MLGEAEHRVNRRHPVYSNLVLIDSARLSEVLLSPRDISLGGLMVESPVQVEAGEVIECSIEIKGKHFFECKAKAAWIKEIESDSPAWDIGFSLEIPEAFLEAFKAAMEEAFPPQEDEEEEIPESGQTSARLPFLPLTPLPLICYP